MIFLWRIIGVFLLLFIQGQLLIIPWGLFVGGAEALVVWPIVWLVVYTGQSKVMLVWACLTTHWAKQNQSFFAWHEPGHTLSCYIPTFIAFSNGDSYLIWSSEFGLHSHNLLQVRLAKLICFVTVENIVLFEYQLLYLVQQVQQCVVLL